MAKVIEGSGFDLGKLIREDLYVKFSALSKGKKAKVLWRCGLFICELGDMDGRNQSLTWCRVGRTFGKS